MLSYLKIISSLFIVMTLFGIIASASPGHTFHKVRIHVPVKHHTHYVTKTKVKTVHIGVPIKEPKRTPHWDYDDDDDEWTYSRKHKRTMERRKRKLRKRLELLS